MTSAFFYDFLLSQKIRIYKKGPTYYFCTILKHENSFFNAVNKKKEFESE